MEAIQILVLKKGDIAPSTQYGGYKTNNQNTYLSKSNSSPVIDTNTTISYQTHVQNIGWQNLVSNGTFSGTSGKGLRLEGLKINLKNQSCSGGIKYQTHVQNIGWQDVVNSGQISGTTGKSLRLEAMRISLTGDIAKNYDIYYRVHVQNYGWLGWAKNGQSAGSEGMKLRMEGMQIVLVKKGENAPINNYGGIVSNYSNSFYK